MKPLLLGAAAGTILLALTACNSQPTTTSTPLAPSSPPSTSAPATPSESPSADASPPAAASQAIQLNKTVDDPVLGIKVTFVQAIRGLPAQTDAMKDRELVVVEVKIDATNATYATLTNDSSFHWAVGDKIAQNAASDKVTAYMTANGYTPLAPVKAGTSGGGWIAGYLLPANSPDAVVKYWQLPFSDSSGKTFPQKEYPVALK